MDPLMIALRIIHILSGVIWVGGVLLFFAVLLPHLERFGPAARADVLRIVIPMDRWLGPAAVLTVASGVAVALRLKWGVLHTWFVSGWGYAILVSFIAVVAYMVIATRQTEPHFGRLKQLAQAQRDGTLAATDSDEVGELLRALRRHVPLTPLLIVAVGAMAAARWL